MNLNLCTGKFLVGQVRVMSCFRSIVARTILAIHILLRMGQTEVINSYFATGKDGLAVSCWSRTWKQTKPGVSNSRPAG